MSIGREAISAITAIRPCFISPHTRLRMSMPSFDNVIAIGDELTA